MDGIFVDDGAGNLGLNGEGQGALRFDLAAYRRQDDHAAPALHQRRRSAVGRLWGDDFKLADGATTLFSDDVESGTDGWTTNHFVIVPLTRTYPLYYNGRMAQPERLRPWPGLPVHDDLQQPATTEWQVDRCPYTAPGMLLWLRNGAYDFDYTSTDSLYNPPSYGRSTPCSWWTATTGPSSGRAWVRPRRTSG